ncbi:LysR substrate-binding domain-containing protein [Castellaniella ginsengisoli]|uniref:LysR substrate-binding domain-containing protein n=1 Tax=Castellaniella ginsengisoli TaxID=546114 RepID=A0AB39F4L3_9BURK
MDLTALKAFDLVATHGGYGKASRASGCAKATLSRRIMELEHRKGVRLIERGARTLRLTEEGAALHARTHGLLSDLADAVESIHSGGRQPRGTVRVSAPVLFSHTLLAPLAAEFTRRYPGITLEIRAEDRRVDLVEDGFDVAIRVNPPADSLLVGRCFARDRMLLTAPAGLRLPRRAATPPEIPAVVLANASGGTPWTFQHGKTTRTVTPAPRLVLSSLLMVRDAVRAGAGAALLPQSMTRPGPATEGLKIWGIVPDRPVELWALHSSRRLTSSRVTAFIDFLCEQFPDRWL